MFTLPVEIIDLVMEFDGRYRHEYNRNIREMNKIVTLFKLKHYLLKPDPYIRNIYLLQSASLPLNQKKKRSQLHLRLMKRKLSHYQQAMTFKHLYLKSQLLSMFTQLHGCSCCDRHQRNCPNDIRGGWDEDPILYMDETDINCKCGCRHYMRTLAYAAYTYN